MRRTNRIGLGLFDEEVLNLMNAAAKIFPITQLDVDTNSNPNDYEYGRVDNHIYRWLNGKWEYIIADDVEVHYNELKGIPTEFPPQAHGHVQLHSHNNKTVLDTITLDNISVWNTVVDKANKEYVDVELGGKSDTTHDHDVTYSKLGHTHPYSLNSHLHDERYYTEVEVNTLLTAKSDTNHTHDGRYHLKAEITSLLGGKSDKVHGHTEADIANLDKYTKAEVNDLVGTKANLVHSHYEAEILDLDKYTQAEVNTLLGGKSNTGHKHTEADISDLDKYTKAETNTLLGGKSNTGHGHSELHTHDNKDIVDKLVETDHHDSYNLSNLQYIEDIRQGYTEGHAHSNFTLLQSITQGLVDTWNSAVAHISDAVKHITSAERTLWNTITNKSDIGHTHDYSASNHNHDSRYYTETEINNLLATKSSTTHTHADKADQTYVEEELGKKADNTTLSYHINSGAIHVLQADKDKWNTVVNKVDSSRVLTDVPAGAVFTDTVYTLPSTLPYSMLTGVPTIPTTTSQLTNNSGFITMAQVPTPPPGITIGEVKPTDGSMWYEVVG